VPLILPCAWVILCPHLRLVFSCPRGSPIQLGFLQTESVCLWRGVESRSCSSALPFLFVRDTIAQGLFISCLQQHDSRSQHCSCFSSGGQGLALVQDRLAGFVGSGLPHSVPACLFLPARFAHRCSRAPFSFVSIFGRRQVTARSSVLRPGDVRSSFCPAYPSVLQTTERGARLCVWFGPSPCS
jgi:hypothetical protein